MRATVVRKNGVRMEFVIFNRKSSLKMSVYSFVKAYKQGKVLGYNPGIT